MISGGTASCQNPLASIPVYTIDSSAMSPKAMAAFRMAPDLMAAMRELKDRDGVPLSEQIDRALRAWLPTKGISVQKTDRKRVSPRKRS